MQQLNMTFRKAQQEISAIAAHYGLSDKLTREPNGGLCLITPRVKAVYWPELMILDVILTM